MTRRASLCLFALVAPLASAVPMSTSASADPGDLVQVAGNGVTTYPEFDPDVHRYGIRTSAVTGGSVDVSSSATGTITVNGRSVPATGGTVSGLTSGDEVAVRVGSGVYSYIYLPPTYPVLEATTRPGAEVQPGYVFLNIGGFETAIDENAVPIHLEASSGSADFKRQPNGHYSSSRFVSQTAGYRIAELNERFEKVASHVTSGLVHTDSHDSVRLPNGNWILISYEPDGGYRDSVLQEVTAAGDSVLEWNSRDHFDPQDGYVDGGPTEGDYAHANSVQVMQDGDWLVSFRNLSSVVKIARHAHDGFSQGEVVWRLGGVDNDFTYVDDAYGGQCAQHTAHELENGHILVFDNGAEANASLGPHTGDFCPDPSAEDPDHTRTARPQTRAVEYALDTAAMTATKVWSYEVAGRYSAFAGSTQRLANANTLVGWAFNGVAGAHPPIATEVGAQGLAWELTTPGVGFSYRAQKFPAPDAIAPEITLTAGPAQGAIYAQGQVVPVDFGCSDRGGSNLDGCSATSVAGGRLVTSTPGVRAMVVTATDGAGNTSKVVRNYTVAAYQPDAMARAAGTTTWRETVRHRLAKGRTATTTIRVQNDGNVSDRFLIKGTRGGPAFKVRYYADGKDVTAKVVAGTYRTPRLVPGASARLRGRVTRLAAVVGRRKTIAIVTHSATQATKKDRVDVMVRAVL